MITKTEFKLAKNGDRGIVMYGNADTNRAWKPLPDQSPIQVTRDAVTMGERVMRLSLHLHNHLTGIFSFEKVNKGLRDLFKTVYYGFRIGQAAFF